MFWRRPRWGYKRFGRLVIFDWSADTKLGSYSYEWKPKFYCVCDCGNHGWYWAHDLKFNKIDRCEVCMRLKVKS